jgi:hypothetical protein
VLLAFLSALALGVAAQIWIVVTALGKRSNASTVCLTLLPMYAAVLFGLSCVGDKGGNGNTGYSLAYSWALMAFGPVAGAVEVLRWAALANPIGPVALAGGGLAGATIARRLVSRTTYRWSVVIGSCGFILTSWLFSELLVEAAMRVRAAQQFPAGYCFTARAGTWRMIYLGITNGWVDGTHASLVDGQTTYYWSFSRFGWARQTNQWFEERDTSLTRCGRVDRDAQSFGI